MVLALSGPVPSFADGEVELPTPRAHYESYDPEAAALVLVAAIAPQLDPSLRGRVLALTSPRGSDDRNGGFIGDDIVSALESLDWTEYRPHVLELFLHQSRVLEVIPEAHQELVPLVHDALLLLLDGMDDRRLIRRIVRQARLPDDAERGRRLLAFVAETPTLQKLGQILARYPDVEDDLKRSLQTLENSIFSTDRDELVGRIRRELGEEVIDRYRLRFSERILAEASVGSVIRVRLLPPGGETTEDAACKILKPYAIDGLREELTILEDVIVHMQANTQFYGIGDTPVVELFQELRDALSKEIEVSEEQENLRRAAGYYRRNSLVRIPEIYNFSTPNITCMEYIHGVKITDAFRGDPDARAKLAERLSEALTFDVIFSPQEKALFHGDPHAGNVFLVLDDPDDRYRIALLDWGLLGEFPREQRSQLVQLLVGLRLGHEKRLRNNMSALVEVEPGSREQRAAIDVVVKDILSMDRERDDFQLLNEVITRLGREGFKIRFNTAVFIKSQLTILGILLELDPDFDQGDYLMSRIGGQVVRETHLRLLRTLWFPAWNSHDYRSMMSNEDVKDLQVQRIGRGFKAAGRALWTAVTFPAKLFSTTDEAANEVD